MKFRHFLSTVLLTATLPAAAQDADKPACNQGTCESSWAKSSDDQNQAVMAYADDYKSFMQTSRTELMTVASVKAMVKAAGFKAWKPGDAIKVGSKYYYINRDRAMVLLIGGKKKAIQGMRIVASHIDSPRLELKGRPLYGSQGFALFQTNYHGGIKTYQWTNIPLALVGRVDRKDGTMVEISMGLNADDPILIIPDLSPHVARGQMKRTAREVVAHEELDPIVASGKHGELDASAWVLSHLKEAYGIDPADLVSAELSLVPAMPPRDVGFDRRLMAIYGQDDRLAGFASVRAAMDMATPEHTSIVLLADNEESGNNNVTGASSSFLVDTISEILLKEQGSKFRQPMVGRALRRSKALSIDVNPGVNPMSAAAWEMGNAPKLGYGINIKLYGRGFDANSEMIAWTRDALDTAGVPWQTTTYKVGRAGGGTLGNELSQQNIDTIDFGVPVMSIHTPYAVSDKQDVWSLKRAIEAFMLHER